MSTTEQNALAQSSSPYLRSAMHQPVRWREWDDEAFAAAARENKPILLDIGAVWCHWCHVMDRESYDSPEIAEIINTRFIPIKVDRDERPDVDSRYQTAVAALSGQGGWPLTAFLTPEGKPFYGGTYFPPQDMMGRPSFRKVLLAIADAFRERRKDVEEEAGKLMHALGHAEGLLGRTAAFSPRIIEQMVQAGISSFDRENGGFGAAPKFPHPPVLDVLIDWYARTGEEQAGTLATRTLEKMALGGVYDQLAGRIPSLLGGRPLARAALREDVLRQLRAAEELRSRIPGDRQPVLRGGGARHHRLDGRVAQRPRARRLLRLAGCRH